MPSYIFERYDTRFHLCGSALTALACCMNHVQPPQSYTSKYRYLHTYIGRIGVIASFTGVTAGLIRLYAIYKESGKISNQILGLTSVGLIQSYWTFKLAVSIRKAKELWQNKDKPDSDLVKKSKQYLSDHKRYSTLLFYGACLGPFWTRAFDPEEIPIGALAKKFQDITGLSDTIMTFVQIAGIIRINQLMISGANRCRENNTFI